jgi:LPPG:FO 2-phospho-L-lactate transferase
MLVKVTALAGGVGGAKLLVGLDRAVGTDLTAIVNTGDDARLYGVHVSPDVDIVTYWLSGLADTERGWGIRGDSFELVDALGRLGHESWFRLGDRDFATCLYRTERLDGGEPLSAITEDIRTALGARPVILPMTDARVATMVTTSDGRVLDFQEYFVKERTEPEVTEVSFDGIGGAAPAPGVLDSIADADMVVLCPSNPIVSIEPIVGLEGVRATLRAHPRVVAVSPIVRGAALKGPADRLLRSLGAQASASGVAEMYADFCDTFIVDASDEEELVKVEAAGMNAVAFDTIMRDHDSSERLARFLVDL